MTSPHDEGHEKMLLEVVTGSRSTADADVVAQLDACADCRESLAELAALQSGLERAGEQDRNDVHEALEGPSGATDDAIAARFRATMASPAQRPQRRWIAGIAAAALLVLSVTGYFLLRSDRGGETLLGRDEIVLDAPTGRVAPGALEFRWHVGADTPIRAFEVQLRDADGLVFELHRTESTSWQVPAARRSGWPDRFAWRVVEAFASTPRASGWTEVRTTD